MARLPLGAANRLFFFNQRTRAVGLPYCNQDVRDQMPYAFKIYSAGCTFWASSMSEGTSVDDADDFWIEDQIPSIFSNDVPRHCSFTLQVQQDELLKTCAMLVPSGYGPCGGGVGRGSVRGSFAAAADKTYNAVGQSLPHLQNRWDFPRPIEIPRNAALSVNLVFSEYAKQLLQSIAKQNWQDTVTGNGHASDEGHESKTYYGIQVTLVGERLIQQRGQLHR